MKKENKKGESWRRGYLQGIKEKKDIDKIWDMLFDSFPSDMENFSTMTENQAYRLLQKFWKKLEDLK